jgi:hypothetical protein
MLTEIKSHILPQNTRFPNFTILILNEDVMVEIGFQITPEIGPLYEPLM